MKKKRRNQTTIAQPKPIDPNVLRAIAAVLRKLAALLEASV
jgi:hypothetical protein